MQEGTQTSDPYNGERSGEESRMSIEVIEREKYKAQ